MRRQQADLRCAHEPPAGTVASATFESLVEDCGCLSAPKMGKLPLGVTVTVTTTPVRIKGDGAHGPPVCIIVTCAARPPNRLGGRSMHDRVQKGALGGTILTSNDPDDQHRSIVH